jgi:mono/diheme cytochrome c family protein
MKKILIAVVVLGVPALIAYEALILYDNQFMPGRMRETPAVRPYEQPLLIMEAGLVPFSGGEMDYRVQKPEDIKSPLKQDEPETIKRGNEVYFTFCAVCHGKYHDGNATVGQSFKPLPTDLRSEKVLSKSDGELFKVISYGSQNGRQPALATTVGILDRWRVIAYIKSLEPRQHVMKVMKPHKEQAEAHKEEAEEPHKKEQPKHGHSPGTKEHKD